MGIRLDECIPQPLEREFTSHDVSTVAEMGFDVFITVDQNIQYQQNLKTRRLALVLIIACNNKLQTLKGFVPEMLAALETIQAGDFTIVGR